ncbi:MAG: glycosyl transferase family protein [Halioglobus sp.]
MTSGFQETEHPFAPFIRILGKGKKGARSLTREEAQTAFAMILNGSVEEVQLGAFLMLLRVKEETAEELAGFVDSSRVAMLAPPDALTVDLDWSSYAGKRNQHPWYLLSALLLTQAGYRVFMHGSAGHTPGRLYSEQALGSLGISPALSWKDVEKQLAHSRFAYLSLEHFCPALHALMQLRPLLGLRSPVNTLTRVLNPLNATASIQSVFHPAYAALHQSAGLLLGHHNAAVFKGESGEVEIKPQADTAVSWIVQSQPHDDTLARRMQTRPERVSAPSTAPLLSLWQGEAQNEYGLNAVLETLQVALRLLNPQLTEATSQQRARALWDARNKQQLLSR